MILCDSQLRDRFADFIESGSTDQINPASIDLRLGESILREPLSFDGAWRPESLRGFGFYTITPGEVLLVATAEFVKIPDDCVGEIRLKSSRTREGISMGNSGFVDPGWNGILTLQIQNVCRFHQINIGYLQRFFQLILHQMSTPAENPYRGRYYDAQAVQESKAKLIPERR